MNRYSALDRLLHRSVLGSDALNEALFDLERKLFLKRAPDTTEGAVFVCGLARAGTTALMRAIHDTGRFASLTYRDMPAVIAPNLWSSLTRASRRRGEKQERAHGDGVIVDFDSPEALEEVFWRIHCGERYIRPDAILAHQIEAEEIERLREYIRLVCLCHGKARYLSKNNNNILRLRHIASAIRESAVLVPFRAPQPQAQSLLGQHRRFLDASGFERSYMAWLVHHEFGATHRPFRFSPEEPRDLDPQRIDYWLNAWIRAYRYLRDTVRTAPENIVPVCYERLCDTSGGYWRAVCARADIPWERRAFNLSATEPEATPDPALAAEAEGLYAELNDISSERLGLAMSA